MRCLIVLAFVGLYSVRCHENGKRIGAQPTGKCDVNGVQKNPGEIWDQVLHNREQTCTCKFVENHKRKPEIVCKNKHGCTWPENSHVYYVGQKSRNCECVNSFDPLRVDLGRHFFWRCPHHDDFCRSKGSLLRIGQSYNTTDHFHGRRQCDCILHNSKPFLRCRYMDGCTTAFAVKGRILFAKDATLGTPPHCKCVYGYDPIEPYLENHYYWVCHGPYERRDKNWKFVVPDISKNIANV